MCFMSSVHSEMSEGRRLLPVLMCAHYLLRSFFFFIFLEMFISETETDRARVGEGQRERKTQNLKQASGSELSAQTPMQGSNSRTVRLSLNRLSHPGAQIASFVDGMTACLCPSKDGL